MGLLSNYRKETSKPAEQPPTKKKQIEEESSSEEEEYSDDESLDSASVAGSEISTIVNVKKSTVRKVDLNHDDGELIVGPDGKVRRKRQQKPPQDQIKDIDARIEKFSDQIELMKARKIVLLARADKINAREEKKKQIAEEAKRAAKSSAKSAKK